MTSWSKNTTSSIYQLAIFWETRWRQGQSWAKNWIRSWLRVSWSPVNWWWSSSGKKSKVVTSEEGTCWTVSPVARRTWMFGRRRWLSGSISSQSSTSSALKKNSSEGCYKGANLVVAPMTMRRQLSKDWKFSTNRPSLSSTSIKNRTNCRELTPTETSQWLLPTWRSTWTVWASSRPTEPVIYMK